MSGKKTNTASSPKSASSDKEELRARERISKKHHSRASAESASSSGSEKSKNTFMATRAESQSELLGDAPKLTRRPKSLKLKFSPISNTEAKAQEKVTVTSAMVFEKFDPKNPHKFLEDAIIASSPSHVYAALQHGMVCDPDWKINKMKVSKILKKPSKSQQTRDWKLVVQYLKAFTIMHQCEDISMFPASTDSVNTQSIKAKFKIEINIPADERDSIFGIIDEQFNTDMGNIFLLVHKVHNMCADKSPLCNTIYEWYNKYQNGHDEVIYVLENDGFLDIFYESEGPEEQFHTITHRDILNGFQPPSSSVSY